MPVIAVKIWRFIIEKTSPLLWVNLILFVSLWIVDGHRNALKLDLDKVKVENTALEEKNKTLETSLSTVKAIHEDYRKLSESYLKNTSAIEQKGQEKREALSAKLKENPDAANFIIPESIRKSLEKR